MLSSVTFGQYIAGNSLLHRLCARTKLLASIMLATSVILVHRGHAAAYLCLFLVVLLGILASRIAPSFYWRKVAPLFWILLLGVIPGLIFTPGHPVLARLGPWPIQFILGPYHIHFQIGPALITQPGYAGVLFGFSTLLVLYLSSLILTLTTTPVALVEAIELLLRPFRRLRVPVDELTLMLSIALRFVPTLAEEIEQLRKAQLARGADFAHGSLLTRARSLTALTVPLLTSALRRAAELSTAITSRGYTPGTQRTLLREGKMRAADYLLLGGLLLFLSAVVWFA